MEDFDAISAKNCLCNIILGSEEKNFGFGSAFLTQFWRCKYGFVYYSNVQRTFKDGKIKSTVFTRPHAMKRHKIILPMLRNGELKFWTPVSFEVKYFLNEETEGVLADTVIYFCAQHLTWLSQLKPNVNPRPYRGAGWCTPRPLRFFVDSETAARCVAGF